MPGGLRSRVPGRFDMLNADEIAKLCYERLEQLPRRGKPEPGREWTLLAAVVQLSPSADSRTGRTARSHAAFPVRVLASSVP